MSTSEEPGGEGLLQDRSWRAGLVRAEQLAAVPTLAVEAARDELRAQGLGVRIEPLGGTPGVAGLLGGFAAARGARGEIRVSEDGRGCRLVILRTSNAEGLAPDPRALAGEVAAAEAARRVAEATYASKLAEHQKALAAYPRAVEEHAREVERAERAWESGRAARAATQASLRGLHRIRGLLAGAGGLALTVVIWMNWDIGAYYDRVFHTWMVLLVIKLLAALLPVAVLGMPIVVGSLLAVHGFRSAVELEAARFSPPRPPLRPRAPERPAAPTGAGLLHDPEQMEALFVKVLTSRVERALAPPARPRAE